MNRSLNSEIGRHGVIRQALAVLTAATLCLLSAPSFAVLEYDDDEPQRLPEVEVIGTMIVDSGELASASLGVAQG